MITTAWPPTRVPPHLLPVQPPFLPGPSQLSTAYKHLTTERREDVNQLQSSLRILAKPQFLKRVKTMRERESGRRTPRPQPWAEEGLGGRACRGLRRLQAPGDS